jgi:butyrate kinase
MFNWTLVDVVVVDVVVVDVVVLDEFRSMAQFEGMTTWESSDRNDAIGCSFISE